MKTIQKLTWGKHTHNWTFQLVVAEQVNPQTKAEVNFQCKFQHKIWLGARNIFFSIFTHAFCDVKK